MAEDTSGTWPTDLRGLEREIRDLVERADRVASRSGSQGNDERVASWIYAFEEARGWAEVVVRKVRPDAVERINWHPKLNSVDLWQLFSEATGFARRLLSSVRILEREGRLFAEPSPEFVLVDPKTPFSSWLRLTTLLGISQAELWVADPYLDERALQLFLGVPASARVCLLASARLPGVVVWEKFQQERGGGNEYRAADPKAMFHDRFVGVDGRVFLSGASLKDVGQRFSTLVEFKDLDNVRHVQKQFEALWNVSPPLS